MKNWLIFTIVLLFLGLTATAGTYFLLLDRNKANEVKVITSPTAPGLPLELTENFDPTVNTPKFRIKSTDRENASLNLIFVFPKSRNSEELKSKITCDTIKVGHEDMILDSVFDIVETTSKELMIFSGLCTDDKCTDINKSCELYVPKDK